MITGLHHIAVTQSRLRVLEAAERLAWTHLKLRNEFSRPQYEQTKVKELLTTLSNQMNTFERLSTGN